MSLSYRFLVSLFASLALSCVTVSQTFAQNFTADEVDAMVDDALGGFDFSSGDDVSEAPNEAYDGPLVQAPGITDGTLLFGPFDFARGGILHMQGIANGNVTPEFNIPPISTPLYTLPYTGNVLTQSGEHTSPQNTDLAGRRRIVPLRAGAWGIDESGQLTGDPNAPKTLVVAPVPVVDPSQLESDQQTSSTAQNAFGESQQFTTYELMYAHIRSMYEAATGKAYPEDGPIAVAHLNGDGRVANDPLAGLLKGYAGGSAWVTDSVGHAGLLAGSALTDDVVFYDIPSGRGGMSLGRDWGILHMSLTFMTYDGADNLVDFNKNTLVFARLLMPPGGGGVTFASDYKNDPYSFYTIAEAFDMWRAFLNREWIREGDTAPFYEIVVERNPNAYCYCAEGLSLGRVLSVNLENTKAGYIKAYGQEVGEKVWEDAKTAFETTRQNGDSLGDGPLEGIVHSGFLTPLWEKQGYSSPQEASKTKFAAFPYRPWTNADLLRNAIKRQAAWDLVGGPTSAALTFLFAPQIAERLKVDVEEVMKTVNGPVFVKTMMYDMAYALASDLRDNDGFKGGIFQTPAFFTAPLNYIGEEKIDQLGQAKLKEILSILKDALEKTKPEYAAAFDEKVKPGVEAMFEKVMENFKSNMFLRFVALPLALQKDKGHRLDTAYKAYWGEAKASMLLAGLENFLPAGSALDEQLAQLSILPDIQAGREIEPGYSREEGDLESGEYSITYTAPPNFELLAAMQMYNGELVELAEGVQFFNAGLALPPGALQPALKGTPQLRNQSFIANQIEQVASLLSKPPVNYQVTSSLHGTTSLIALTPWDSNNYSAEEISSAAATCADIATGVASE